MLQLDSIAQLAPMAREPGGPGVRHLSGAEIDPADSRGRSGGRTERISNQYEAMLAAAPARDEQECGHVIACTLAHTLR